MSARLNLPLQVRDLALAAVAQLVPPAARSEGAAQFSEPWTSMGTSVWQDAAAWQKLRESVHPEDSRLLRMAGQLGLTQREVLTVALALAVEQDPVIGHMLACWQRPAGGTRPTLGLISRAFSRDSQEATEVLMELANGRGVRSGLLVLLNLKDPLPEQAIAVPIPLAMLLTCGCGEFPGVTSSNRSPAFPLPESVCEKARQHAGVLASRTSSSLLIRSDSISEGREVARSMATTWSREVAFIEGDAPDGLGPWLLLRQAAPAFVVNLGPGEHRRLFAPDGYEGPILVLAGREGTIEVDAATPLEWRLTTPGAKERGMLWAHALGDEGSNLASTLARKYRHGVERISQLGGVARHLAALDGRDTPNDDDVRRAVIHGTGGRHALAEPVTTGVSDAALVVPETLRGELQLLAGRCRIREDLASGLGPAVNVRYRPGVRALFVGPSGCGKTLAASWLATQLELPLYSVDLACITSKYIGETEKNLAQLFSWAETAEVILLFDEADSLFAKRTDVRDSNDRFANAQTNYLLQRIEGYDGIVVLTSNSKSRFDAAFARRLDVVLEFALPTPEERRELWRVHLGPEHWISPPEINQLAALADLAGGHIRNAVLTAAVVASESQRPIQLADCVRGLDGEYRKLGRQLHPELVAYLGSSIVARSAALLSRTPRTPDPGA